MAKKSPPPPTPKEQGEGSQSEYTPERLKNAANQLRLLAASIDGHATAMEHDGVRLLMLRDKMFLAAHSHIRNFAGQIEMRLADLRGPGF